MKSVKTGDTRPELAVRRLLHRLGYRFRLHLRSLPGRPDIAFSARRKAIFVHGCFWHSHSCPKGRPPKSRLDYWLPKLARNVARDVEIEVELKAQGWTALVVWQCELKDETGLVQKLVDFLGSPKTSMHKVDKLT